MLTKVPGLDSPAAVKRSKLPPLTNLKRGLAKRSPVVLINARTGKRHPIWVEIDSNAEKKKDRVLIIRPARNLDEGERYIVALRNLRTASGREIKPSRGFRIYRDRIKTGARPIERRRKSFERIFKKLKKAGVKRGSLYLAWDFTVASERSLAGRMLHIRDDAFGTLGDTNLKDLKVAGQSPTVSVDTVTDYTTAQDDRIARKVEGHMMVPCYLTTACAPGGSFRFDKRGLPRRMGVTSVPFVCNIPRSALDPASPVPARASLYGHGLLGRASEIDAGNVKSMSNEHNFVFCATPWAGFANEDIPHIISVLGDFSALQHRRGPDAAGLPQHAVPRPGDDPPGRAVGAGRVPEERPERARHHAPVLRRQQPGRDHGRSPDRGGAGLRPRRARRARHELLDAASAQRGLRHVRGDHLPELPDGDRPPAHGSRRYSCSGTAARRTATRST